MVNRTAPTDQQSAAFPLYLDPFRAFRRKAEHPGYGITGGSGDREGQAYVEVRKIEREGGTEEVDEDFRKVWAFAPHASRPLVKHFLTCVVCCVVAHLL